MQMRASHRRLKSLDDKYGIANHAKGAVKGALVENPTVRQHVEAGRQHVRSYSDEVRRTVSLGGQPPPTLSPQLPAEVGSSSVVRGIAATSELIFSGGDGRGLWRH